MYAGTMKSSTTANDNIFYWLFRDPKRDTSVPLVIWLNGGPGSTSMFGLFAENGPLRVSRNGTGPDDFLVDWQDPATTGGSWFDVADVLYIDQPVGTGFSYGESLLTTME
jgi:carboxypeptidase C (cathepsin A)